MAPKQGAGILRVAGTNLFSGNAFSVADGKGRFVLPLEMRKLVKLHSGNENRLCVSIHDKHGCAIGFGLSHKQRLEDEVYEAERNAIARGEQYDVDEALERRFSMVEDINFDDGGRFFLPPDLKDYCGIEDVIFFYGVSRYFQMWRPETLLASEGRFEPLKTKVRNFLADRKGKA